MTDEREKAWGSLQEALPARWRLGPPTYDPAARAWSVSAVGPHPGRGKIPPSVSGHGDDEIAAVRDLDDELRGRNFPGPSNLDALRARLRLSYLAGAEEWARRELGRPLDRRELAGVLSRFSGD